MSRTSYTFNVLQAIAAVASFAVILWSLGLPVLQFAEAANVNTLSDTLTDSAPAVVSDHTIDFITPTGVAAGETITVDFEAGFTGVAGITDADVDLAIDGVDETIGGGDWTVSAAGQVVTITSGAGVIAANATVTIEIGTNADGGTNQITNPATEGSYTVDLTVGSEDTGQTRVAIVNSVTVTATVDTVFTFTINEVAAGTVLGTHTTGGASSSTTIPFGELVADTASTAAQNLEVSTNAANGFVVTVATDQQLTSGNGADIDGFIDGAFTNTPTAWESPGGTAGLENEAGHWGISSDDTTLTAGLTDLYTGGANFVSASTTPVEVFRHDGPTDGSAAGEGTANVIYKVEVTALQEAATDYTATLTYVATPVF